MRLIYALLAVLALSGPALANVERPDFTFFTIPDLYFQEPTIEAIQTGNNAFGVVLNWLFNNVLGIPANTQGYQQVPLSRLLGQICAVHQGRAIGSLVCPLSSLYNRALSIVNSLGSRASNLGNAIINDFLGQLGNALQSQINNWVGGAIGLSTIDAVSASLYNAEQWLSDTVSAVERQIRRGAYQVSSSWLASVFPGSDLALRATDKAARKQEAQSKLDSLIGALQVSNLGNSYQEQQNEASRQNLREQAVQVERKAPKDEEVSKRLSEVSGDLAKQAEDIAKRAKDSTQAQASVRGVLVEMSQLQAESLRMQLTSEDRLVKLAKEQIQAQAATNQILAAQTRVILRREMEALEQLKGQSRQSAEEFAQELMATNAVLEGFYQMPVELSRRQAEMSESY
ncbi:MAG: hypothetical protein K6T35_01255 [Meiothermus silvanus]|nr:hypothetical protein [Allomeiothermus silvanus]